MVAAGGATALVAALLAFSSDETVCEHACGAVWNIAGGGDEGCRLALLEAGAQETLQQVAIVYETAAAGTFAQGALASLQ